MAKDNKDSAQRIKEILETLKPFGVAKASTARDLKKKNPLNVFYEKLDSEQDDFVRGVEKRGAWVKQSELGLYLLTVQPPLEINGFPKLETDDKAKVPELFKLVRELVELDEKLQEVIIRTSQAPKAARKPRKVK